jgi:hypothetical protein
MREENATILRILERVQTSTGPVLAIDGLAPTAQATGENGVSEPNLLSKSLAAPAEVATSQVEATKSLEGFVTGKKTTRRGKKAATSSVTFEKSSSVTPSATQQPKA